MNNKTLFDDLDFFEKYINLRTRKNNYNDLIEQPEMLLAVGCVQDKDILDIGCGYGATVKTLHGMNAKSIIGIDISEAMIEKAIKENSLPNVEYKKLDIQDISKIDKQFDIVISSLVFHYIKDLNKLFCDIFKLVKPDGNLVFSIEHPMATASKSNDEWIFDNYGIVQGYISDSYECESQRTKQWLDTSVIKYHHKISTIVNNLIEAGFIIEEMIEPAPSKSVIEEVPKMAKNLHRPVYLIIKCKRK